MSKELKITIFVIVFTVMCILGIGTVAIKMIN